MPLDTDRICVAWLSLLFHLLKANQAHTRAKAAEQTVPCRSGDSRCASAGSPSLEMAAELFWGSWWELGRVPGRGKGRALKSNLRGN